MQLWCALVNSDWVFSVEIPPSATVEQLARRICVEQPEVITCPATQLNLYLAKESGTWLSSSHPDVIVMKRKRRETTSSISCQLSDDLRMDETMTIRELIVEAGLLGYLPLTKRIHVLVQLPESQVDGNSKRSKIDIEEELESHVIDETKIIVALQWKDKTDPVYLLANSNPFFVNQAAAIAQLQQNHRTKFIRAYCGSARDEFQKTLCACHTVRTEFDPGELAVDGFESVGIKRLVEALKHKFEKPPPILSNPPTTSYELLEELTDEIGSLFIVLDEIGVAFDDESGDFSQQCEHFTSFTQFILSAWLQILNVFFVLLGHGPFLSYVALSPSPGEVHFGERTLDIERLSLQLLRPRDIRELMEDTRVTVDASSKTIKGEYGLGDSQTQEVAEHLFKEMCGHLQTLLVVLQECHSFEELMGYTHYAAIFSLLAFHHGMVRYKQHVKHFLELMETGDETDLSLTGAVQDGKCITLALIANCCCVAWERTLKNAKMYASPWLKRKIEQHVLLPGAEEDEACCRQPGYW